MNTLNKSTLLALSLLSTALAHADRTSMAVTGQRFISNASEATIDGLVSDGYRMHDIEITSTSPLRFAGSFVKNEGAYEKAWWWTANKTHAQLAAFMAERNARMIDMEITTVNGQKRYAGTFIKNVGDDQANWQAVENLTWAQLQNAVNAYNGRIIDLDVQASNAGNRFSAVMVKNTGSHFKNFTYFSGRTLAQVNQLVGQSGQQLIDLERINGTTFAGVLESNPGWISWYQVGRTWDQLQRDQQQFNARVADIEHYSQNGALRYNYILINNCNALETRVGQLLRNGTDGVRGFYIRRVGGPRLAQLMADYRFYPASSIKMLEHMYWSWRVQNGLSQNTNVRIYTNHTADTHPANSLFANQSLITTQQNMMFNSSNQDANALQEAASPWNGANGRSVIMTFAQNVLGLDNDIQLNHKFADGGMSNNPYNVATGREYGLMMEKATDGSVFNANGFAYLRNNMLNETSNASFANGVRAIANQEGALLGMTQPEINTWWAQVRLIWKGGNNGTTNVSSVAHAILPMMANGRVQMRAYVLNAFIESAQNNTFGANGASATILPELLREEIRAGLASW
jgi:hypothetical protein